MDLSQVIELVKELKEIVAALLVAAPLAMQFWQDAKRKGLEAREKGFLAAAQDLYHHGEELKTDWKKTGRTGKDLVGRLRAMAPHLLMRYGLSKGVSEEDIQKILGLSQSIHKAQKTARSISAPSNTVLVLPEESEPVEEPLAAPEPKPEDPADPPEPSAE
jgi:hypothetical protein